MSKSVLICGVDDSEVARRAAHVAAELSKRLGARLVLLNVAPVTTPSSGSAFAYEKLKDQAIADAKRLLERLKQDGELSGADEQIEFGSSARALVDAAASQRADPLVVGTRGRGALKTAVLGSVSSDVATEAPLPRGRGPARLQGAGPLIPGRMKIRPQLGLGPDPEAHCGYRPRRCPHDADRESQRSATRPSPKAASRAMGRASGVDRRRVVRRDRGDVGRDHAAGAASESPRTPSTEARLPNT
jgi:nucleotide-binding universal stress UspA family protein